MATIELTIRTTHDDPCLVDVLKALRQSQEKVKDVGAAGSSTTTGHDMPEFIKLLLEYENNGGQATWEQASIFNARAYRDPRGAGGMYTPQAGYFVSDQSSQMYRMTEKALTTLEHWKRKRSGSNS